MSTDQAAEIVRRTWLVIDTLRRYEGKKKTIDFVLDKALKNSAVGTNHSSNSTDITNPKDQSGVSYTDG